MSSHSLRPLYLPLVQKPFCCNVTCLMMILYRNGFGLYDQETLAAFFKIKIPKNLQAFFTVTLPHCTSKKDEGGLRTIEAEKIVNRFFSINKIPLHAQSVRASSISNLGQFIEDHLQENHDLWIEYKSHEIHKEDITHDNVIESIQHTKTETFITLVDPYSYHKTRFEVPLEVLARAISTKFGRETGFLVITRK